MTGFPSIRRRWAHVRETRPVVVHCEKTRSAVYMTDGSGQHFYVRTGLSTTELNLSQMQEYISERFH